MFYRKVDINKVAQARRIIEQIAAFMKVCPSQVPSVSRAGKLPYVRQLACYFIRNSTMLQCDVISTMIGYRCGCSWSLVSRNYKMIKERIPFDDKLRKDITELETVLNN